MSIIAISAAASDHVLVTTSLVIAAVSSILNAAFLAFTYHRASYRPRSAAKASVTFALGVAYVASIGVLAITRAVEGPGPEVTATGSASSWAWAAVSVLSLSVTLALAIPDAIWRDCKHDHQR